MIRGWLSLLIVSLLVGQEYVSGELNIVVRLEPPTNGPAGRLEANLTTGWTPFAIDGNGFSMQTADLACKYLGYSYASQYNTVGALGFFEAVTPSSITHVACLDFETNISVCNFGSTPSYPHSRDVAIICTNETSRLRLVSNSGLAIGLSSGRLEIYVNNTWGTVCNQFFHGTEATLACRQLGFERFLNFHSADQEPSFTATTSAPIWLYRFSGCDTHNDLRLCSFNLGSTGCDHNNDIILYCESLEGPTTVQSIMPSNAAVSSDNNVRLVDINGNIGYSEGRLEIYYGTSNSYTWIPFCFSYFNGEVAGMFCRQLGYTGYTSYDTVETLGYDEGSGPVSISTVTDCGRGDSFYSCSISTTATCSHSNDVVLTCTHNSATLILGLTVGLTVGLLVCCVCTCVGVLLCVVLGGVVYHHQRSKKTNSPRSSTVQYTPQGNAGMINYGMPGPERRYAPSAEQPNLAVQNLSQPNQPVQNILQANQQAQTSSQPSYPVQNTLQANQVQNSSQPSNPVQNTLQANQVQNLSQSNYPVQNTSQANQVQNLSQSNHPVQNTSQASQQVENSVQLSQPVQTYPSGASSPEKDEEISGSKVSEKEVDHDFNIDDSDDQPLIASL